MYYNIEYISKHLLYYYKSHIAMHYNNTDPETSSHAHLAITPSTL